MTPPKTTLADDIRRMRRFNRIKRHFDKLKKHYEAKWQQAREEVWQRMREEMGDDPAARVDGVLSSPYEKLYASVKEEDREAFAEWAREQDETYLEEVPRKSLLNQIARQHLDDGVPLPPGLTVRLAHEISERAS